MSITNSYHFILVEDSVLDSYIGSKIIEGLGDLCKSYHSFLDPFEAFEYIEQRGAVPEKTIIFLDIQMPLMSGFEFVEKFETQLSKSCQKYFVINILSSSINEKDIIKAKSYSTINQFMSKPLTKEMVLSIVNSIENDEKS